MKPINRASLAILAIMGLFCCRSISGAAQTIEITSFKDIPEDLTAVSHGTSVLDQNGEKCALIKVETTQTGFSFDPGALGVVKTDYKPGEIWVYVPHGVKKITISHPTFGVLRDYDFPHALQRAHTYLLTLHVEKGEEAFQAETSFVDKNLSRTTLFTLDKNEIVYHNEHFMDLDIDKERFACVLKDTITNEMTYVWNGIRKISTKNIYVCYNDLYDYDKCILMYSDSIRYYQYIKIEGMVYGPYDDISYLADWGGGVSNSYNSGWPYKNIFTFKAMGGDYINIRGRVTPLPNKYYERNVLGSFKLHNGKKVWYLSTIINDMDTLGYSPNEKYHLEFKGNRLVGNNKTFNLPFVPTINKEIHVYDNGKAIIRIMTRIKNNKVEDSVARQRGQIGIVEDSIMISKGFLADINTGILTELKEDECFDYKNGAIIKRPSSRDRQFEYKGSNPSSWYAEQQAICLQDKTLQHTLLSRLDIPYVLLNNQKVGTGSAIYAIYDEASKCFLWTSIEDDSIVLYEYKL